MSSEEKIVLEIDQPETIIAYGVHVCFIYQRIGTKWAIFIEDLL